MEQTYFDKTVPQTLEQVKATANGLTAQEAAGGWRSTAPTSWPRAKRKARWWYFWSSSRICWSLFWPWRQ